MISRDGFLFEAPLAQAGSPGSFFDAQSLARDIELREWEIEVEALYYNTPSISVKAEVKNWTAAMPLSKAIEAGKGKYGVYIIERSGKPVYSGKAGGGDGDLAERMRSRLEYARQSGDDLRTLRVRLGIVANKKSAGLKKKIETIERTVVRSLKKVNHNIRNIPLIKKFRAGKGGVNVKNVLPKHKKYRLPSLPGNQQLKLKPGESWEM